MRALRLRSGILGFLVIGPSDFAQGALAADVIRTATQQAEPVGENPQGSIPSIKQYNQESLKKKNLSKTAKVFKR